MEARLTPKVDFTGISSTRLEILWYVLFKHCRYTSELIKLLNITKQALNKHLRTLETEGLLIVKRLGNILEIEPTRRLEEQSTWLSRYDNPYEIPYNKHRLSYKFKVLGELPRQTDKVLTSCGFERLQMRNFHYYVGKVERFKVEVYPHSVTVFFPKSKEYKTFIEHNEENYPIQALGVRDYLQRVIPKLALEPFPNLRTVHDACEMAPEAEMVNLLKREEHVKLSAQGILFNIDWSEGKSRSDLELKEPGAMIEYLKGFCKFLERGGRLDAVLERLEHLEARKEDFERLKARMEEVEKCLSKQLRTA